MKHGNTIKVRGNTFVGRSLALDGDNPIVISDSGRDITINFNIQNYHPIQSLRQFFLFRRQMVEPRERFLSEIKRSQFLTY